VLAQARGGTLFVDQVDALPPDAQAALVAALRGLQEAPPTPDSCRVIGATSGPLPALAAAGAVQPELAVRLGGFSLALPPLRERRGDLGLLVGRLLGRVQGGDALTFTGTAVRALCLHTWPGNVSELAACLASAASLAAGQPVAPAHLPPAVAAAVG
jgi:DNA-binding NtrC family response regulator